MAPNLYSDDDEAVPTFKINSQFAEKYDSKKRIEELSKLKDKYGSDLEDEEDSEDLSDDDSDAELVTPQVDAAILRTLAKIRNKDPEVYEKDKEIFDEEEKFTSQGTALKAGKKDKSSKPVLLKDYQRARLLEGNLGEDNTKTFVQEEQDLKDEVKRAFMGDGSDESDDDLLVQREKTKDEVEREEDEYQLFLESKVGKQTMDAVLSTEEAFLKDYILNRGWIDKESQKIPTYNQITGSKSAKTDDDEHPLELEEDDEHFEEVEEVFENTYNFRFEEKNGAELVTHARQLAKSVRKQTSASTARSRQRDLAKERQEAEKVQRKEEIARLKALKRKEVEEKLKKIVETAGSGLELEGLEIDLEGDWDPEEHDKKMREVYGEDYEEAEDDEFKPTWDDDIDIGDILEQDSDVPENDTPEDKGDEVQEEQSKSKSKKDKKAKKKSKGKEKDEDGFDTNLLDMARKVGDKNQIDKMMDEVYDIDFEDKIGDLKTRFKYTDVKSTNYDLTPTEILLATDAELNEFISLKKLAPYRTDTEKNRSKKLKKLKEILKTRTWGETVEGEETVSFGTQYGKSSGKKNNDRKRKRDHSSAATSANSEPVSKKREGKKERMRKKQKLEESKPE